MATGKVKFFNDQKNFGFITPDDGSKDVFVHGSDCLDGIVEEDNVEYEVEQGEKGPKATNVKKK